MDPHAGRIHLLLVGGNTGEASAIERVLHDTRRAIEFRREEPGEPLRRALDGSRCDLVILGNDQTLRVAGETVALVRACNPHIRVAVVPHDDSGARPAGSPGASQSASPSASDPAFSHDGIAVVPLSMFARGLDQLLTAPDRRSAPPEALEQLLLSDRMTSVGTLAAGVSHEINNRLAALMMNLEFATRDLAKLVDDVADGQRGGSVLASSDELRAWMAPSLEEIVSALQDARDAAVGVQHIARDLKMFSHAADERVGVVDVRRAMESALRMAWIEIRHRARLVKDYGDVPRVIGTEARVGQLCLNLVLHAARSIPEGHAAENEIRVVTRRGDGPSVVVEVRDTGPGIPTDRLPHVFEPLFSDNGGGIGSGYGLAICQRLVAALGGTLHAESRVGEGATFRAVLPAAGRMTTSVPKMASMVPSPVRAKVLVVDDDAAFCDSVRRMLRQDCDVMVVTSGRDVLARLARGEHVDALLCDLLMPDCSGMDLHSEVVARFPEFVRRIVFMTGGAFTKRSLEFLAAVENPCLQKPFDAATVAAALRPLRPTAVG